MYQIAINSIYFRGRAVVIFSLDKKILIYIDKYYEILPYLVQGYLP